MQSGNPVQSKVELVNLSEKNEKWQTETTNAGGELLLCLPVGSNYSFSVEKKGYLFYSGAFDLHESREIYNPYQLKIGLTPVIAGAEMHLYNIYFETDSFRILPDSEPELQKLAGFLKDNPSLKVEIQGHTDNTGNEAKNLELSEKRAHSVVEYLVENKIDKTRLSWKGFGEKQPVAENETPEGRRMNRRTTVKIE
jgi:outer membrane protein OmpA-like peptidoglycan-associated protein